MGTCFAGSIGKTTTAWLIRGIFEEWGKLTGMAGTIENAIYADKLDAEGALWTADEPDPTLDRRAFLESSMIPLSWSAVQTAGGRPSCRPMPTPLGQ